MKAFILEVLFVSVIGGFTNEVWADSAPVPTKPSCNLVDTQIRVINNQLQHSDVALADLNKSLKWDKAESIISDIAQGVFTVASLFVGGSALEAWAVKTGLPFLTKLFAAGKLTTAATASAAGLIIMVDGKQVYAKNADEARVWVDSRIQELEQKATSGGHMLAEKDIEEAFTSLGDWYKKAEGASANLSDNSKLSDVRIPFVQDTIRVLKLKLAYFQGQTVACVSP